MKSTLFSFVLLLATYSFATFSETSARVIWNLYNQAGILTTPKQVGVTLEAKVVKNSGCLYTVGRGYQDTTLACGQFVGSQLNIKAKLGGLKAEETLNVLNSSKFVQYSGMYDSAGKKVYVYTIPAGATCSFDGRGSNAYISCR